MFRLLALSTVALIALTLVDYLILTLWNQPSAAVRLLEVVPGLLGLLMAVLAAYEAARRRRDP
jgi:Mn2+/Fe2+ NRAMP family transporter